MIRRPLRSNFGMEDRSRLLEALGRARTCTITCSSAENPSSERYAKCSAVTASIDALAEDLTGDPTFFHTKIKPSDIGSAG
jgi:hypothetical protein